MAANVMMTTMMVEQNTSATSTSSPSGPDERKSTAGKDFFRSKAPQRVAPSPAAVPGMSGFKQIAVQLSGTKPEGKSWELAPTTTKTQVELRTLKRHRYIIDPHATPWVRKWDVCMMFALAFTVVVTPVEVAYLDEGEHITLLFWLNRIVDLIFLFDLLLTFNLAYQMPPEKGGHYVFNRWMVTRRYLAGWFMVDLFSVLPFFLITLDYDDPFGGNVKSDSTVTLTAARVPVMFRVVKLLRMLKLTRVFKASKVFERTVLDVALHHWEWTFAVLKLLKLVFLLCVYAHLQACVWGLLSAWMPEPNWISEFDQLYTDFENPGEEPGPLDRYAAGLYWSVMTLTSIGYGDFVPKNTAERWLCSLYMLLSGVLWTYVIGSVAAIATTLNPNQILYENTMDQCVSR